MTLQLAGAGRSTVRADRGAVAEAQERRREQKEAAKVLRQLRELTAELDRRDEDKARMAEGGRATRNNQAAAWAPIDIVAQLQAELSAAQRQLAQSESHRASETKRLRDFEATISLMHSDHKEADQWLKDKGDVHTDVLSLESELKTSKRETSALRKELNVAMDDIADTTELLTAARAIGTGKEKKLQHLQERSTVLQSLNMSKAQLGKKRGVYIKPIPIGTPIDPKRQRIYTDEAKTRRDTATSKALTKSIGEDADPDVVARALKDYNVLLRALLHERSTLHGLHVVTRERTTQRTTKNHLKVKITSSASVSLAK